MRMRSLCDSDVDDLSSLEYALSRDFLDPFGATPCLAVVDMGSRFFLSN